MTTAALPALRLYGPDELGSDGYPPQWHMLPGTDPLLDEADLVLPGGIKHAVRALAGHRCVRCLHPYRPGAGAEWSPCDGLCAHRGPFRYQHQPVRDGWIFEAGDDVATAGQVHHLIGTNLIQAQWRVLTVHHLDGVKANCRWWNLAALCQRCHLQIQGKVRMERVWPWEHTEWFRPYVAGYYAHVYLREDLTRAEAEARLDELLGLERMA